MGGPSGTVAGGIQALVCAVHHLTKACVWIEVYEGIAAGVLSTSAASWRKMSA